MLGNGMVAQQLADSDAVEKMTEAYATVERRQLRAACDLADAVGISRPETLPPVEDRQRALQALLKAVVTDSFEEFWADEIGASLYDSAPPARLVGVGRESDAWTEQIETWADRIRESAGDVDATDRELANIACREVYGTDLDEFESEVVELDRGAAVNQLFAGNFRAARHLMERATEEIAADGVLDAEPDDDPADDAEG